MGAECSFYYYSLNYIISFIYCYECDIFHDERNLKTEAWHKTAASETLLPK